MRRRTGLVVTAVCILVIVGCGESGSRHATASLQSERRSTTSSDDTQEDPLGDVSDLDDFASEMDEVFGGVFGGTTDTTVPTGSLTPSKQAATRLGYAVGATLAESSLKTVVRQEAMGMNPEVTSVSSTSGDRSESVMDAGLGLSTYYRYIDGTVYVRQDGAGSDIFGVEMDKWAIQPGDPAMLRRQIEGMTGLGVFHQLSASTDVGPADPARIPPSWDADEVLAFALRSEDLMGGEVRCSGLVGIRDGRIVEVELVGDTALYLAGRKSDRWMPFNVKVSVLNFGVGLGDVTVPPPGEMAN